jgi:hypothetical protein
VVLVPLEVMEVEVARVVEVAGRTEAVEVVARIEVEVGSRMDTAAGHRKDMLVDHILDPLLGR